MTLRLLRYSLRALTHHRSRAISQVLAIGTALALLGSLMLFVLGSLGLMTASASARVPLDWQAAAPAEVTATSLATKMQAVRGVASAAAVATGTASAITHQLSTGLASAGMTSILAIPPDYPARFGVFHILTGGLSGKGVLLSQPLASTLQAQVGDTVSLQPNAQAAPVDLEVSGIAVIDASELLFQPLGGGAAGNAPAPPSQVIIAPVSVFAGSLATATAAQWEVHARVDHGILTGGPAEAQQRLATFRHVVERTFPGELVIADNLDATLGVAAEQALYGQAIFIFLALPGVLIALWLAYFAALSGGDDERRDIALLRTRGASRADVRGVAVAQGIGIGLVAAALGVIGAVAAVELTSLLPRGVRVADLGPVAPVVLVVGVAAALGARLGVVGGAYRAAVAPTRARAPQGRRPLWARLHLDLVALLLSAVVFGIDRLTGLSAVVNPDSNPTLALSLYSFLAPTLLWVGCTLLLVRVGSAALAMLSRRLPAATGSGLLPFLLKSAGRRAGAISRAFIVVGLLLSFGVSLGLFSATYDQQGLADARLTVGADVVVNAKTGGDLAASALAAARAIPGVAAASAMRHTYAYVGPDLQDLFGLDATGIAAATHLRDSYFSGQSAEASLRSLRQRNDGVMISAETIKDYGLSVGDLIRLRLLDAATGQYRVVDFHVAGVVKEFPTAPKDSFLLANLDYVLAATHTAGPNVDLIAAAGPPSAVGGAVQNAVAATGATTRDITGQLATTSSSLTAISLAGISRLEEGFAVGLALVAVVLFSALNAIERRREFAIMAAMGTHLRTVASFLWTETAMVIAVAALLAAALGTVLALMLVTILTHVFDPPPDALAVPWGFLGLLAGALLAGALASMVLTAVSLHRADLSASLREG